MAKLFVNRTEIQAKNGMMLLFSYLTLFVVNLIVIYLASMIAPSHIVLGTYSLTPLWALCLSVSKLTLLGIFVMPLVAYYEYKNKKTLRPQDWMFLYFVVNFVSLWGVSRFSHIYGLGLSSWLVTLVIAIVLDAVQGVAMMNLNKIKLK